jgi:predicted GNAT family acetyltransferase
MMIRKLTEADRMMTMNFLSEEPSMNLFIIGDIEAFGFEADFQEVWGQFDDQHQLEGVLLRYRESFIPYFKKENFNADGFKEIVAQYPEPKVISGEKRRVAPFDGLLPNHLTKETYFCEIAAIEKLNDACEVTETIRVATPADAPRVVALIDQIDEFTGTTTTVEATAHKIETKTGRIYYIEDEDGKMVAVAQTSAENSKSAMIVGVASLPAYRSRGYVSACMSALCRAVMMEGKTLCLFYDNPKAGKIYHRLGFETIGNWTMIKPIG